jgi:hypothetical protein
MIPIGYENKVLLSIAMQLYNWGNGNSFIWRHSIWVQQRKLTLTILQIDDTINDSLLRVASSDSVYKPAQIWDRQIDRF